MSIRTYSTLEICNKVLNLIFLFDGMLPRFIRSFSTKSPEFYASTLAKHQQFAVIDREVNIGICGSYF